MKLGRNTIAKSTILNMLQQSEVALSHAELQANLEGVCDRVTIYRVLERLSEEGLIHKIVNIDGAIKYAACHNCDSKHQHNHVHFSCNQCKSVTCLEQVEPTFRLPKAYRVQEVHFTITGICPQCAS